jgi:hypothetical protein
MLLMGVVLRFLITAAVASALPVGNPAPVFAQAGSTGGTVGKQGKSLSSETESPGSAPARKPRAAAGPAQTAGPSRGADIRCRNVAGVWTWTSSLPSVGIALTADGSAKATNGSTGTWSCADGMFTVTWQNGVVDRLVVSEIGTTMSGTSGFLGVTITATKK